MSINYSGSVYGSIAALTVSGQPSNDDTITLNSSTYTFKVAINNANANEVLIGATAADSVANLSAAIVGGPGSGIKYSSATTVNPVVVLGDGTSTVPINADPPFPAVWPYPTGFIYSREFFDVNLRMVRESTYTIDASVVIDGAAQNVTGYDFYFTAKWDFPDTVADAVFQKTSNPANGITVLDAAAGSITIDLNPADTTACPQDQECNLYYDLTMANADNSVIYPLLRGVLTVVPNVTALTL